MHNVTMKFHTIKILCHLGFIGFHCASPNLMQCVGTLGLLAGSLGSMRTLFSYHRASHYVPKSQNRAGRKRRHSTAENGLWGVVRHELKNWTVTPRNATRGKSEIICWRQIHPFPSLLHLRHVFTYMPRLTSRGQLASVWQTIEWFLCFTICSVHLVRLYTKLLRLSFAIGIFGGGGLWVCAFMSPTLPHTYTRAKSTAIHPCWKWKAGLVALARVHLLHYSVCLLMPLKHHSTPSESKGG